MKQAYQLTADELKKQYRLTDFDAGLTSQEAHRRLAADGKNILEVKPTPKWKIFLRQFNNIVIYILLVAALLTVLIGHTTDAIVIMAVVILNSLIGYFQETSAANALAKIQEMMAQHATVYRDGQRQDVDAADLVVGDVVFLEAGDNVPADLRIVSADNLRIEESALTGETNSVIKTAAALDQEKVPLAERFNMAYSSTSVTSGSEIGVVVATGEQTEIGKVSQEVAQIKPKKTRLTKEIDHVGTVVFLHHDHWLRDHLYHRLPPQDLLLAGPGAGGCGNAGGFDSRRLAGYYFSDPCLWCLKDGQALPNDHQVDAGGRNAGIS